MKFSLTDDAYRNNIQVLKRLTDEQKTIARKAGTENPKFLTAWTNLYNLLSQNRFDLFKLNDRFDIRALSIALTAQKKLRSAISINNKLLDSVTDILPNGSTLFIESLTQFFLKNFDAIEDPDAVGSWLCVERKRKGLRIGMEEKVLCTEGPVFIAKQAILRDISFEKQIQQWQLDAYATGDFVKRAQTIYYVEQLQAIPVNTPHKLLNEISEQTIANSRYNSEKLIGHVALQILIDRAPTHNVHDSWQNAVIAIAGDPRVPNNHPRFIKWWSHLNQQQIKKVQGWLSKLDLKLFLEALEDYSKSTRDASMMRMFPSRKHFLEGMYEAGSIIHTKLYLSQKAHQYIRQNYRSEHVPDYSIVVDGDRSIIYAELTSGHMIEGSHNCQIWFYKHLHESAPVLKYGKQNVRYEDLTGALSRRMTAKGYSVFEHFTHVSSETFKWQQKSVEALKRMGVNIRASDVLSESDYNRYKRIYGVG